MSKYAADIAAIKATTEAIQGDVAEIKEDVKDLNKLKERVAIVETKQTLWGAAQAIYTTTVLGMMAWFRTQK